jgi:hypothetical protein
MRHLLLAILLASTALLCAADNPSATRSVELLTLRNVLGSGIAVWADAEAFRAGAAPIDHLPDRSLATLIAWIRDNDEAVLGASISYPQNQRFLLGVVAVGDIADCERVLLADPVKQAAAGD